MKCPYCGQEHPDNSKFCSETGKSLHSPTKKCPNCGYENVPIEAKFCPRCRYEYSMATQSIVNEEHDVSKSQIVFICSEDGALIEIGYRQERIILKNGKNIITVQEYPGLQNGFSFRNSIIKKVWSIRDIILSDFNTSKVQDMSSMFGHFRLKSLDLSSFDTSNVTNMHSMFWGCDSLRSLDLSNFNTSNVQNMSSMFHNCSSLETLDLSGFNTSNVEDMNSMFDGCSSLRFLDLSSFDTSNLVFMISMFSNCHSLVCIDLSGFKISDTDITAGMFDGCESLKKVIMKGCDEETINRISETLKFSNTNAKIIKD